MSSAVLLNPKPEPDTMDDIIIGTRRDLQREHDILLARVQDLRRLLGFAPIQTGKQQRRERSEAIGR